MNIKEFSAFLGASERTIQNYLAEISLPNGRFLTDLAEKTGVSLSWVMMGTGPKYLDGNHQKLQSPPPISTASQFIPVTRFAVEASAGHCSLVQDETGSGTYAYNKAFLDRRGLKAENLAVIAVSGDSMEPNLRNGDLILIDRAEVRRDEIKDGRIYVVTYGGDLYVKRIQRLPQQGLMLVSSNPVYQPVMVNGDQMDGVKIIGRVVNSTHEW